MVSDYEIDQMLQEWERERALATLHRERKVLASYNLNAVQIAKYQDRVLGINTRWDAVLRRRHGAARS